MFLTDRAYEMALDGRKIDQSLLEEMSKAYSMVPSNVEKYSRTEEYHYQRYQVSGR